MKVSIILKTICLLTILYCATCVEGQDQRSRHGALPGVRSRGRDVRRGRNRKQRPTTTELPTGGKIIHTVHNGDVDGLIKQNLLSSMKRLEKAQYSRQVQEKKEEEPKRKYVVEDNMDKFKTVPKSAEEYARKNWEEEEKTVSRSQDAKSGHFSPSTRGGHQTGTVMDCDTVMRDPTQKMSSDTKDMMCDMYKQWGAGMHKPAQMHMTKGQKLWFDSLGMDARSGHSTTPPSNNVYNPPPSPVEPSTDRFHGLLSQEKPSYPGYSPEQGPNSRDNSVYSYNKPYSPEYPLHNLEARPYHPYLSHRGRRQSGSGRIQRKEYRSLSDEERHRLHTAIRQLKNTRMDGLSKYDLFVGHHQANMAPGAHFGPAFLGWHRELLFRFENALREVDAGVALPYWDSNLDHHIGDDLARQTMMWTADFLGNGDGLVTTGPFAHWPLTTTVFGRNVLHRNLTVAPPNARTLPSLMSDRAVATLLQASDLRDITWFVDAEFEGRHGATHNWVGGVMGDLANSPNDPAFFLHHAFIDCLWEQQRRTQARRGIDIRFAYPNDSRALGVGIVQPDGQMLRRSEDSHHWWASPMQPFGPIRNIDGLKEEYYQQYECVASPSCSASRPDCGTPYMFCDRNTYRCAPKVFHGASCGTFSSDICHNGQCCDGVCRSSCGGSRDNRINFRQPPSPPRSQPPARPTIPQQARPTRPQQARPTRPQQARPTRPQQARPTRPQQSRPTRPSQPPAPSRSPAPTRPFPPPPPLFTPPRQNRPAPSSRRPPPQQRPTQNTNQPRSRFPGQVSQFNPFFGNPFGQFGVNRFNNFFDPRFQRQPPFFGR